MTRLTDRQQQVARLVAHGLDNQQIAKTLGISERTTRHHVYDIFQRLGTDNRTQLAVYALKHGIADLESVDLDVAPEWDEALDAIDRTEWAAVDLGQECMPPTMVERAQPLTPCERNILRMTAAGLSNDQIADALVLSERTVRTHMSNVLAKLGVANRLAAAMFGLRAKWFALEDVTPWFKEAA